MTIGLFVSETAAFLVTVVHLIFAGLSKNLLFPYSATLISANAGCFPWVFLALAALYAASLYVGYKKILVTDFF